MRAKNITGEDIKRIIDLFTPLIDDLEKKSGEEGSRRLDDHKNPYSSETRNDERRRRLGERPRLPPGWKEVLSPAGNTFYLNTKTGASELEAPETCISDMPFSEFMAKPSALDIFQRMKPDFYEPLDKAFKSAAFKNLEDIRAKSQRKVDALAGDGTLESLVMSKEEAEVLFSYTYEAEVSKESPCYIMNTILAERNDNQLQSHRGYILHLLKALRKLKPVDPSTATLYRGIDGTYLKFDEEHYKVGNVLTWPAFTSTAMKEDVAYSFMKRAAQPIIFEIHGDFVGYSIKLFSKFSKEEEVLLEPETTFKVISIQDDKRIPKAKRVVIDVQQTPLMVKDAVENFARAEYYVQNPHLKKPQTSKNTLSLSNSGGGLNQNSLGNSNQMNNMNLSNSGGGFNQNNLSASCNGSNNPMNNMSLSNSGGGFNQNNLSASFNGNNNPMNNMSLSNSGGGFNQNNLSASFNGNYPANTMKSTSTLSLSNSGGGVGYAPSNLSSSFNGNYQMNTMNTMGNMNTMSNNNGNNGSYAPNNLSASYNGGYQMNMANQNTSFSSSNNYAPNNNNSGYNGGYQMNTMGQNTGYSGYPQNNYGWK